MIPFNKRFFFSKTRLSRSAEENAVGFAESQITAVSSSRGERAIDFAWSFSERKVAREEIDPVVRRVL